jgi:ubiquinone/menaquinone biosynthesis C-methylase UbiE
VDRLGLKPGQRVLEVSVGTGTNLPFLAEAVGGSGQIVGLDISRGMLGVCAGRFRGHSFTSDLVEGEAAHLPLPTGSFDAVLHHGGIAEFGNRAAAIAEMYRVVRPGGRLVVCDVGVPPEGLSLVNRFLMLFQPEYNKPPPTDAVPPGAQDTELRWYFNGGWYMLSFRKPTAA